MKNITRSISLLFVLAVLLTASCNKETYIETIGKVLVEEGDETAVGSFIFVSAGATASCEQLDIYVDGIFAGKLTSDYSGNIDCRTAPVNQKIVKVIVATGSHKIIVKYKNGCKPDGNATQSVQANSCFYYRIS